MFELLNNSVNSNYFIINIKLKFPEYGEDNIINLKYYDKNGIINFKNAYISIIRKWVQNILDQYSLLYNVVLYIANLNYDTIRVFIYFNPLSYSNMDKKFSIYLTDMINYDTLCKLNMKEFTNMFRIEKLHLLIDLEFEIIKPSLDTDEDSDDSSSSNDSISSNDLIESMDYYNKKNDKNTVNNNKKKDDEIIEHHFDIIEYEHFEQSHITKSQIIKQEKDFLIRNRFNIIQTIGISGINKITFLNEINKISMLERGNIYSHPYHTNYDTELYIKIKENNEHIWIPYQKNINLQNIIKLIIH